MEKTKQAVPFAVPRHVAIIMDGNNRWAKKRFMPGVAGHKAGSTLCVRSSRCAPRQGSRC